MPTKRYTIDPITRLEGHGKIDILLNEKGDVDHAYLQVPELRGFERFAQGRPAEDMPQITSRICGVCPTAHHMAATKALDDLYKVTPPPAALKVRELVYNIFMVEDHALHFFFLGGPDFVVGPTAPKAERNILGVLGQVGLEVGKEVIGMRKQLRELMILIMGKAIHPVFGLPGGISKAIAPEHQKDIVAAAEHAVEFGKFTLKLLEDLLAKKPELVKYITSESYTHRTYYMGMVDSHNKVNFYDGSMRVVDPNGKQVALFPGREYLNYIAEHVEPWSYVKYSFLKNVGWKGFVDGPDSGIMGVAPMARLNAADGLATPIASAAYQKYLETLGGKPVHFTLATSWARVIELIYAAERMRELAADPEIVSPEVRTIPTATPTEGIGVIEAPRGTLIHHYKTDEKGLITMANLIVATQNNSARIQLSVDKAAKGAIKAGKVDDGILNLVEMAFRAYDPCHGCATHALPGQMPLRVRVFDANRNLIREFGRG
jgi:F420-non-reducing hydrogenase large subunit